MSRKIRKSRILDKAVLRIAGLKAIDLNLDLGDTCNLANMTELITELRTKINAYNTAITSLIYYRGEIEDLEKTLSELCEKMLIGIAFKYGKDSQEYELAGGVRTSVRIRKSRATRLKVVAEQESNESA